MAWEHLGLFGEFLDDLGLSAKVIRLYKNEKIPFRELGFRNFSSVISLGAPFTAHLPKSNPHHEEEVEFFKMIKEKRIPSFNICYSMQLFSIANGGKVEKNPNGKEVGIHELHLTGDGTRDSVFGFAAPSFRTLQWHQDQVIELPKGSIRLAFSEKTENQIAVTDGLHYLVQGDGQAAYPDMMKLWIEEDRTFFTEGTKLEEEKFLDDLESHQAYFRDVYKKVLTNFAKLSIGIS